MDDRTQVSVSEANGTQVSVSEVNRTQVSVSEEAPRAEEFKFLTIRQILCKIDPRSLRKTPEDDHIRRESCVWSFHKSSHIFPTIIILRQCYETSVSSCNHDIFFYYGSNIVYDSVSGSEIRVLLSDHGFGCPQHFQ